MSRDQLAAWRAGAPDPIRWSVISSHGIPDWARESEVRTTGVPFKTTDGEAQVVVGGKGLESRHCRASSEMPTRYW